ncbi:MAG: 6-bladed beta-propeller [Nitrospira sp.]|nr:6-bladed beta-propeller [Nitrospira sp.]
MLHAIRYTFLFIILIAIAGCATYELETQNMEPVMHEAGPVWPPPPQTPRIQYIRSIYGPSDIGMKKSWFRKTMDSIFGKDEAEEMLLRPYGIFAGSERIYVTDPGNRILHVFDMGERKYHEIKKTDKEGFKSPIGVASDKNGEIFLSDSLMKRVFVFDKEGKYLREIGSDNLFIRPAGIAIDEERLYVVDTHGNRILVFSKKDGSFLFSFGKNGRGKGEFNYPTNIFAGKDKFLYITDSMNFRIQIFDTNGNFISTFGKHGDGSGDFSKPKGIAVDSEGYIYVADAQFDTVQIFDKDGRLFLAFGKTGRGKGQMILPAGLFIDEKDRIYVADSYNKRIQIFQYLGNKQ